MAQCLAAEFNSKGWNIGTEERTDDDVINYDDNNTASREVLGLQYTPIEQSIVEMANSLIESGYIPRPIATQ